MSLGHEQRSCLAAGSVNTQFREVSPALRNWLMRRCSRVLKLRQIRPAIEPREQ